MYSYALCRNFHSQACDCVRWAAPLAAPLNRIINDKAGGRGLRLIGLILMIKVESNVLTGLILSAVSSVRPTFKRFMALPVNYRTRGKLFLARLTCVSPLSKRNTGA